ncbi:MAG: hypothetical protein AAGF85_03015 [Bacteroidota bacterium]
MWRFTLLSLIIFISCNDDGQSPDPRSVGYLFFPLQGGNFIEYEIEETIYQFEMATTTNFQRRVVVVDSFQNQAGEITHVLHRFERPSADHPWEFVQTNSARLNATQGIFVEGNIPLLKLSFPISAGRTWDGNALNSMDTDQFVMDSLFAQFVTASQDTIAETLTVIQEDNQDFIANLITNYEIYGLGIGLVYKEEVNLRYCTEDDCIGQQIIDNGRIFRQSLIDYGQE